MINRWTKKEVSIHSSKRLLEREFAHLQSLESVWTIVSSSLFAIHALEVFASIVNLLATMMKMKITSGDASGVQVKLYPSLVI
jgi:hypothetical protein